MLLARPTTNPLRLPHAHGAHAPGWFSFWYTRSSESVCGISSCHEEHNPGEFARRAGVPYRLHAAVKDLSERNIFCSLAVPKDTQNENDNGPNTRSRQSKAAFSRGWHDHRPLSRPRELPAPSLLQQSVWLLPPWVRLRRLP